MKVHFNFSFQNVHASFSFHFDQMKVHFHFSQFIIIQNHITNIHPILATFSFNFDLILNDYELKMKHERSGRFDLDILLRTISSSKKNRQKLDFVVFRRFSPIFYYFFLFFSRLETSTFF